eukprot:TRINITY_DN2935_c0_g1_i1.p1 TRINITY_DN2935_c0_g1~~TRINITY_DN2935_c0_g1_i1.p1  ORF type:complete len:812 (-),score=349.12 TRINITY_DN2935_c0_g1_i1:98-2533(-)
MEGRIPQTPASFGNLPLQSNTVPRPDFSSIGASTEHKSRQISKISEAKRFQVSPRLKEQLEKVEKSVAKPSKEATKPPKVRGNVPSMPDWATQRPYLTGDYLRHTDSAQPVHREGLTLAALPLALHEAALIEDLLFVMMGIEGQFVKVGLSEGKFDGNVTFTLDATIEPSMASLVNRIVPVCRHYVVLSRFVERQSHFDRGLVHHAFCAAISSLVREYLILVAQLEHQHRLEQLTLLKFWYYVQPTLRTLEALERLASEAADHAGGSLLNHIYAQLNQYAGDQQTKELLVMMMERASVPFFEMLEAWIYKGAIQDTYGEFFVEENEQMQKEKLNEDYNDDYWEHRYTIKQKQLPSFLSSISEKILVTGKYLNVMRECGVDIDIVAQRLVYTPNEREYVEKIETAYEFASRKLLDLLLGKYQLLPRLRSIKHYFLLDQGDFFVHFMDIAADELKKPAEAVAVSKLESLLGLSLRTSAVADTDPFKDDLRCVLLPYTLSHQLLKIIHVADDGGSRISLSGRERLSEGPKLKGLETFSFDYKVQWPLSLIINRKALTKYQLLFRHLFLCKHVSRSIGSAWTLHQSTKELNLRAALSTSFSMRQRMVHFLQNLDYYMTFEVLEPNWHLLEQNLAKATTIDEVIKFHNDFLDTCLKECMLTDHRLVKIIHHAINACDQFAEYTQLSVRTLQLDAPSRPPLRDVRQQLAQTRLRNQVATEQAKKQMQNGKLVETMARMDTQFKACLKQLMDALNHLATAEANHHTANLALQLDFSGFYQREFERKSYVPMSTPRSESLLNGSGPTFSSLGVTGGHRQ